MGQAKKFMMEQQEHRAEEALAKQLGISHDELSECDWEFVEDESDDGVLYGTYIQFGDSSPEEILKKIPGYDGHLRRVAVDVSSDDDDEPAQPLSGDTSDSFPF